MIGGFGVVVYGGEFLGEFGDGVVGNFCYGFLNGCRDLFVVDELCFIE